MSASDDVLTTGALLTFGFAVLLLLAIGARWGHGHGIDQGRAELCRELHGVPAEINNEVRCLKSAERLQRQ